jgi:hypothetical protein
VTDEARVSFIPDIWSEAVLERMRESDDIILRSLRPFTRDLIYGANEIHIPVITGAVGQDGSGFAIEQLGAGAQQSMAPVVDQWNAYARDTTCAITCEPGLVPIFCPSCHQVALYFNRLHRALCHFNVRQIVKLDGTTPAVTDRPTCGACSAQIEPLIFAEQLEKHRAVSGATGGRMGVAMYDALVHQEEALMRTGIAPATTMPTTLSMNDGYITVTIYGMEAGFVFDNRGLPANTRCPDSPTQEAAQQWCDDWAIRHHWMVGTVRISEHRYDDGMRGMICRWSCCRPPAAHAAEFNRAFLDEARPFAVGTSVTRHIPYYGAAPHLPADRGMPGGL